MANQVFNLPPIQQKMVTENGDISGAYVNWINSIYQVLTQFFNPISSFDPMDPDEVNESAIPVLPKYTTTQRGFLQGVPSGGMLYDTTLEQPLIYVDGAWYKFTLTAV